ncbi:hypothetical protein ACFT8P_33910 [Streptomyces sp. NPDC057101]|uniref:hypothetical protein n=1 Tax=Streptomyces sp. NPDC057101 TaxID=3346020 RepID=UPI00362808E4
MAAGGDWDLAAIVADDELPQRRWNAEALREFVASLAPGNDQNPQITAAELYVWAKAGLITAERCADTWAHWSWLALRARDDRTAAVEEARGFLRWAECSADWLDYLLCRLMERVDDDARQAAKDTHWCVLTGTVTYDQVVGTLAGLLHEADHQNRHQHGAGTPARSAVAPRRQVAHLVLADEIRRPVVEQEVLYTAPPTRYAATVTENGRPRGEAAGPSHRSTRDEPEERSRRVRDAYVDHRYPDSAPVVGPGRGAEQPRATSSRDVPPEEPDEDDLRDLEDDEFEETGPRPSFRASGPQRESQEFSDVGLADPEAEAAALDALRRNANAIRKGNQARYQRFKSDPGEPIKFHVYGGDSTLPVLVLDGTGVVTGAATPTYGGSLTVHEKAGGLRAKAGRFLRSKPADKFSAGTLAGTMEVTQIGEAPIDRPQLQRLLKKNGITDKRLLP